jgi:V8-like Glu-specific endopeptidase
MNNNTTLLEKIRTRQKKATRFNPLSFILEVTELTGSQKETARILYDKAKQELQVNMVVHPLFPKSEQDEELRRFFHLKILTDKTEEQSELFQLSYQLLDTLGLRSCEPDLETDFAHEEPSLANKESALGGLVGCFTDAEPPADPLWALHNMAVPAAWEFSVAEGRPDQGQGVLIGHIDTGVNDHDELDREALDLRYGANFIEGGSSLPTDPLIKEGPFDNPGHGIATGSVIISRDQQDDIVTGTAPKAKILPVRSIRSVIRLSQRTVAQGVDYARRQRVQVITMSLGGLPSFALQAAIKRAVKDNIIVLAAAGNCAKTVTFPARFDACIAVAGTNIHDTPWQGSCRGRAVDVSAPAESVYRAIIKKDNPTEKEHGKGEGTSYAVALTAGVAALWLAHFGRANLIRSLGPGETLQERFRSLLKQTARVPAHGNWSFRKYGAGIVNAEALLNADPFTQDSREFREAALVRKHDENEVASELGSFVAETMEMRADDLGMNLAQRSRYGLELSALALEFASRTPVTTENALIKAESLLSEELSHSIKGNISGPIHQLLKSNTVTTRSVTSKIQPGSTKTGSVSNQKITTSLSPPLLQSISNTDRANENSLIIDPYHTERFRHGKAGRLLRSREISLTTEQLILGRQQESSWSSTIPDIPDIVSMREMSIRRNNNTRETIIGSSDDRIRIHNTEADPWCRICCLIINGPAGRGVGTGFFVGPRTVITAGHCVHDQQMGGWAQSIRVIPGRDESKEPFSASTAYRFSSVQQWVENGDPGFDIGVIHLDDPLGEDVGWFGLAALSAPKLKQYGVNIAGYAGDSKFMGTRLAFHSGQIMQVDTRRIYYDADTWGGTSGAPAIIYPEGDLEQPVVVGIHAYGEGATPSLLKIEANSAPRILPAVYDLITHWIAKDNGAH